MICTDTGSFQNDSQREESTINSNVINNVTIRSTKLLPSLQLTDQPTLRYSFGRERWMSYKTQCECTKIGGKGTACTI